MLAREGYHSKHSLRSTMARVAELAEAPVPHVKEPNVKEPNVKEPRCGGTTASFDQIVVENLDALETMTRDEPS